MTSHVDPPDQAEPAEPAFLSRAAAEKIAQDVVNLNIQRWKRSIVLILTGFGAFVLLGVSWSDFRYFLFEKAYPPSVAYDRLKDSLRKDDEVRKSVATDLLGFLGGRVDSGYSKTLYVSPDQKLQTGQNILQFYATPNQVVELTVTAVGPTTAQMALLIDNTNPYKDGNPSLPYRIASRDISKLLQFRDPAPLDQDADTQQKTKYIHTLLISPIGLGGKMRHHLRFLSLFAMRKYSHTFWALAFMACWISHTAGAPAAVPKWDPIAPGIDIFSGLYPHRRPINLAKVWGVRINPARYRLKIIDVSQVQRRKAQKSSYTIPSLRTVDSEFAPLAALNGSFISSYAFPQPVALVRINGVTIHPVTLNKTMSGLLCINREGEVRVLEVGDSATSTKPGETCADALQSSPRIVEANGKNGIGASEPAARVFDRSAVCTTSNGSVILLRAERTSLFDLREFLRRQEKEGGFGCTAALNMDGDADSGLLWKNNGKTVSVGNLDASLATAIAVVAR